MAFIGFPFLDLRGGVTNPGGVRRRGDGMGDIAYPRQ